jgi:hypothetical protein
MLTFFTSLLVRIFHVFARLTPEELEDKLQEWPEGVKSNIWMKLEVIEANRVGVLASDFQGYLLADRQPVDSGLHCYKYRDKPSHVFLLPPNLQLLQGSHFMYRSNLAAKTRCRGLHAPLLGDAWV